MSIYVKVHVRDLLHQYGYFIRIFLYLMSKPYVQLTMLYRV